jgi:cell division protease FtsH
MHDPARSRKYRDTDELLKPSAVSVWVCLLLLKVTLRMKKIPRTRPRAVAPRRPIATDTRKNPGDDGNERPETKIIGWKPGSPDDFDVEPRDEVPVQDAARLAVELMIRAATEGTLELGLVPGAVVILRSPGDEWTRLLDDHWRRDILGLNADDDWQHWRNRRGDGPAELIRDDPWTDSKEDRRGANTALASMATGHGLLAISLQPDECLPPEVRAAADAVYEIQPLSDLGLQELAVLLCGLPRYRIVPGWASGVTATALRVAYRPGQNGSDFINRLRSIVAAASGHRSSSSVQAPVTTPPRWTLENLHGMAAAVAWGMILVGDLTLYREGKIEWADCDRGALLAGPPGVGKTTFAAALAASAGVPLISASYALWESGPDGKSSYNKVIPAMRASFAEARKSSPCILFIDELDSLPTRGDAAHNDSWFTPITNALLAELDGLEGRPGVVVVAATNHAQRIDPALRRAGRLDRVVEFTLPDESGLADILGEHLGDAAAVGIELSVVARRLIGRTGADVEQVVRGARRRARAAGRQIVVDDLLEELAADHRVRSPALHARIAVHEAGHAVHTVLRDPSALASVSLLPAASGSAGGAWTRIDCGEATAVEFDSIIENFLAGRAAEVVVLGDASSGCGGPRGSDLGMATFLAVTTDVQAGLGAALTWRGEVTSENLDGYLRSDPRLAHHVEARLQRLHDAAVATLTRHKGALVAVADALIVAEVLSGEEVAEIVARHPPAGESLVIPPWPLRIVAGSE